MAACGSLQHIFEKPLPEMPTLLESLSSWKNQINPIVEQPSSFTEIFGELHFKDISNNNDNVASTSNIITNITKSPHSFSSYATPCSSTASDKVDDDTLGGKKEAAEEEDSPLFKKKRLGGRSSLSFTPMNYESLQLCTEGLGFESSDEVDVDMKSNAMQTLGKNQEVKGQEVEEKEEAAVVKRRSASWDTYSSYRSGWLLGGVGEFRRTTRGNGGGERGFPPPISCIGKSGKPWVSFKSYREEGRFVLQEVRIPTQEFLHASREDGRLKLKFVQPEDDEEFLEEDDEGEAENCLEEDEKLEGEEGEDKMGDVVDDKPRGKLS